MQTIICKSLLETPRNSWATHGPLEHAVEAFRRWWKVEPTKCYEFEMFFYFVVPVLRDSPSGTVVSFD